MIPFLEHQYHQPAAGEVFPGAVALGPDRWLLRRRPAALALFGLAPWRSFASPMPVPGSLRHHGHLFILLVAALWLAPTLPLEPPGPDRTAYRLRRPQIP